MNFVFSGSKKIKVFKVKYHGRSIRIYATGIVSCIRNIGIQYFISQLQQITQRDAKQWKEQHVVVHFVYGYVPFHMVINTMSYVYVEMTPRLFPTLPIFPFQHMNISFSRLNGYPLDHIYIYHIYWRNQHGCLRWFLGGQFHECNAKCHVDGNTIVESTLTKL